MCRPLSLWMAVGSVDAAVRRVTAAGSVGSCRWTAGAPSADEVTVRPIVKPALHRLWRDGTTLQLGLDADSAVVLGGVEAPAAALLALLDGTRDRDTVLRDAARDGLDPVGAVAMLELLNDVGVLDDADGAAAPVGLPPGDRERLAPDLASVSLLHAAPRAAAQLLARRQRRTVVVHGAGRVGAPLVALLAAAGIGRVVALDSAPTRSADLGPGGLAQADEGLPRDAAVVAALRRAGYGAVTQGPMSDIPDLVVLAPVGEPDDSHATTLVRARVPHLLTGVRETTAVVGPLVLPGRSACLRCQDLNRADRDPAWPALAAQLRGRRPSRRGQACDATLAVLAAGHAALQSLAFLDGDPVPACVGGSLELTLPDWRWRRRSWPMQPGCGCGGGEISADTA